MTQDEKLQYLTEHEFFQDFNRVEMWTIERKTTMTTCEVGRLFYTPGEQGEVLFILKEGTVHLYRLTPDGRKLIVATLGKGTVFGEMSLIGQRMHNTFAEAASPARICVMSRRDVEDLLRRKPELALRLMGMIADRLKTAERQLEQMAFRTVPSRLAGQLLELADQGDEINGLTHQDLAQMIGTHRETATATLNDFKSQGLIETGRKHIKILDRGGLIALRDTGT